MVSLFTASETSISSLLGQSKELYNSFCRLCSQISHSGTSMLEMCFTCRFLNFMHEILIAVILLIEVIYRNLTTVYSGCLNFEMEVVQPVV